MYWDKVLDDWKCIIIYAVCVLACYRLCITVVNYCNRILTNTSFLFMYSTVVQIRVCLPFHSGL